MLSRAWLLVSLAWMFICLWGFNDSGEIHRMNLGLYAMMFAGFIIRWLVIFVVYGLPRPTRGPLSGRNS
jgi:hypothetical protein